MIHSNHKMLWGKTGLSMGLLFFLVAAVGIFVPPDKNSVQEIVFSIEKGEGSRDIAYNLQMQGLTRSGPFFRLYVLTTGVSHKLQAGDYLLGPSLSLFDIVQKFTRGDVIKERITIIEGWNIQDITEYLEGKGIQIDISRSLEGYLFPDTYYVPRASSGFEIITMMRQNFEKKFDQVLRDEMAKQNKTTHEVITMASLVEKEVRTLEDKKVAAGILWKRLSIGMALQVDAAPITYVVPGLPQNPIASSGLESIQAALYPTDSPYWYYLSTPEGKTIFSKTLEEHNIAKAKYLKN